MKTQLHIQLNNLVKISVLDYSLLNLDIIKINFGIVDQTCRTPEINADNPTAIDTSLH